MNGDLTTGFGRIDYPLKRPQIHQSVRTETTMIAASLNIATLSPAWAIRTIRFELDVRPAVRSEAVVLCRK